MKNLIFILLFFWMHDYHSTIMNVEYKSDKKVFEIDFEIPTDHFEEVLQQHYNNNNFIIDENENDANAIIEKYLNETIELKINNKSQNLEIYRKEIDYAITTIYFKDLPYKKRKLKSVAMQNSFMHNYFNEQKNLVNIYYKGKKQSLVFDAKNKYDKVGF